MEDINFKYKNLNCIFSSKSNDGEMSINLLNCNLEEGACFGRQFYHWTDWTKVHDISYEIYLYRDAKRVTNSSKNNYCLLNKEEVLKHMEYINENIHEIAYSVKEERNGRYKRFKLNLEISGNRSIHKFILTWVRHLYEFPFTMFLVESLKLKNQIEEFKEVNLFNLCQLVGTAYTDLRGYRYYRTDQCMCLPRKKFMSFEEIKKGLQELSYITFIWKNLEKGRVIRRFKCIPEDSSYQLSWWLNEDNFNDLRLPIYKHNLKQYLK